MLVDNTLFITLTEHAKCPSGLRNIGAFMITYSFAGFHIMNILLCAITPNPILIIKAPTRDKHEATPNLQPKP